MPSEPKKMMRLTYFDSKAKAESVRLAFFIGGVEFEDKRVSREEFGAMKESLPFGQLPILTLADGSQMAQSLAILTYAAKQAGLLPEDPLQLAKVMQVLLTLDDIVSKFSPSMYEKDPEKKLEMRKVLAGETLPFWLSRLDRLIEGEGKDAHSVGNTLTAADLQLYVIINWLCLSGVIDGIPKDVCNPYKNILRVVDTVHSHPKVAEWNAAH
eukprot:GHVT01088908.1.p1 GENE.GHVT01088908.1~~GHVT01088908.1.p1  ORF type:complete len:212 (-),score=32.20 GHVT01088908.1:466-1101(-)